MEESSDPGFPGRGEVRLRMLMAPVNPADRLLLAGAYAAAGGAGETVGAEGVGRIEAVGAGLKQDLVGRLALPLGRGNWTEVRLLPREQIVLVPEGLPIAQAAMMRINPATAARMLDRLGLAEGDWLIQNASRSSVANWVRRLAERRGVRTLNVVRGELPSSTPDHMFVSDGDFDAIGAIGPAGALDAVAGEATGALASRLRERSLLLVYGHLSGRPCAIPSMLLTSRRLRVEGFSLRPAEQRDGPAGLQALYDELAPLAAQAPEPVGAIFQLDELGAALAAAAAPGRSGRILLALG